MRVKAKWLGREATLAKLRKLSPDIEVEIAAEQLSVAKQLASRISARAPVQTGEYRNSIEGDRIAGRSGKQSLVGLKGRTTDKNATGIFADFIWRFVEFGTVKMSAQPHIFPTYRAYKKTARRKVAGAVNKAIRKAKG